MQKITPFLWFNDNAEEAMNFYVSVFKNSKIIQINRGDDGKVFTGTFKLNGSTFRALNGGLIFKFNEAISFFIECANQAEIDSMWEKLLAGGGTESQCGWLKDRFGVSWQVVPKNLGDFLGGDDAAGRERAMAAMMKMVKLDIGKIQAAYEGKN
jgi:predicted 3-demethylubiquinone-9 3-methyltransferase (glyoxalase superfamily)